ncbi:hypothetical protein SEA_TUCO_123 [Mycobacterium phage Tuco]|nr:hypothetical protein SEA_TUCO_123 [Mycobacterium phage Tuco]
MTASCVISAARLWGMKFSRTTHPSSPPLIPATSSMSSITTKSMIA